MKLKKQITYILLITFIVSIIGIPLSYHFCSMMNEKSLSDCNICSLESPKEINNCCESEIENNYNQKFLGSQSCCQQDFEYKKIEDGFILNKIEPIKIDVLSLDVTQTESIIKFVDSKVSDEFYSDSSPPFLIDPELHISNSVFLI
jgi:predicted membrane protein